MTCAKCEWAREHPSQDSLVSANNVVGCALLATETIEIEDVKGTVYSGWMRAQRRPDVPKSQKGFCHGALINGPHIVERTAICHKFQMRSDYVTP